MDFQQHIEPRWPPRTISPNECLILYSDDDYDTLNSQDLFSPKTALWEDYLPSGAFINDQQTYNSSNPFFERNNNPFARLPSSTLGVVPFQSNPRPRAIFPTTPETPLLPHNNDWMAFAQQEMELTLIPKRMRAISPPRSYSLRSDGTRKKNARFEIPPERSLLNIDLLIQNSLDGEEIKELKQQKRLLRNRQAALDSRQRKKKHSEEVEEERKAWVKQIDDLEAEPARLQALPLKHPYSRLLIATLRWSKSIFQKDEDGIRNGWGKIPHSENQFPDNSSDAGVASSVQTSRPAKYELHGSGGPPTAGSARGPSKWSLEEDNLISKLRGAGMKWDDIAKRFPGRSAIACRLRYQNHLERRAAWDEEKRSRLPFSCGSSLTSPPSLQKRLFFYSALCMIACPIVSAHGSLEGFARIAQPASGGVSALSGFSLVAFHGDPQVGKAAYYSVYGAWACFFIIFISFQAYSIVPESRGTYILTCIILDTLLIAIFSLSTLSILELITTYTPLLSVATAFIVFTLPYFLKKHSNTRLPQRQPSDSEIGHRLLGQATISSETPEENHMSTDNMELVNDDSESGPFEALNHREELQEADETQSQKAVRHEMSS